jgi:hypothetical protein
MNSREREMMKMCKKKGEERMCELLNCAWKWAVEDREGGFLSCDAVR